MVVFLICYSYSSPSWPYFEPALFQKLTILALKNEHSLFIFKEIVPFNDFLENKFKNQPFSYKNA